MHRFFLQQDLIKDDEISLNKDLSHQVINVLRMNEGDKFELFNNTEKYFLSEIIFKQNNVVNCKILDEFIVNKKNVKINVFQSIIKSAKMELIIEKLTEIGISSFNPIITERTQKKDVESFSINKLNRLKKISIESSEQSGKIHLPEINTKQKFKELDFKNKNTTNIVFYENTKGAIEINSIEKKIFSQKSISIFIGPVGGFSSDEIEFLKNQESLILNLGNTIFKSDTAAIISVSLLKYIIAGTFD